MDLVIYMVLLVILGTIRVSQTAAVSSDEGIADTGNTIIESYYEDIPVGQNLELYKESGAYTLILKELELMRC